MTGSVVSIVILYVKPHLTKGVDWSQDVFTVAHNGVHISKTQLNEIKLQVNIYLFDNIYFNTVVSDH